MKTEVLVTGENGQLAKTIKELYFESEEHTSFTFVSKEELDITNLDEVTAIFSKNKFDYCVNCAAYTNVEQAEEDIDLAFKVNAEAVKNIATACKNSKTTLIHISTDYVFDGEKNTPYLETDKPNPINEYGRSKLKGEQYIQKILEEYYIIRTSWLYSVFGKNFLKSIANKVKENADLKVTIAETGTPTNCLDLAAVILQIIDGNKLPYGIYHYSNLGEANWYNFAKCVASQFEDYNLNKLQPVDFFKTKARRPKYSVMSKEKISKHLKSTIENWDKSVVKTISFNRFKSL